MEPTYFPLNGDDIDEAVIFFDRWVGENYYTAKDIEDIIVKSQKTSFVARMDGEVVGIRLSYAPGDWVDDCQQITPESWNIGRHEIGYFKSLFVSDEFQKMGIGRTLSTKSIEVLKKLGARGILCHSWLESPGNSSQIYLSRMGFEAIKEHKNFWYNIPYMCVRCRPERCTCTGVEMIKYI